MAVILETKFPKMETRFPNKQSVLIDVFLCEIQRGLCAKINRVACMFGGIFY